MGEKYPHFIDNSIEALHDRKLFPVIIIHVNNDTH
jgi:hypothetical protein